MTDATEISAPPESSTTRPNPWRHSFTVGCILLGLISPLAVLIKVATTGGNVLSNDYIDWTILISRMLDGNYDWRCAVGDTFVGAHSVLLPVLVFWSDAYLFAWNVHADLLVGLVITFARSLLLFDTLTNPSSGKVKWILFPIIMALNFGASQASVLLFGETSIPIGLALLGFTIALWGVCKFNRAAPLVLVLGGLISSYSFGNTLPCWATLTLALVLLRPKDIRSYLAIIAGCAVTALPYALRFKANVPSVGSENTQIVSFVNLPFIINLLGRPFAPNVGTNFGWMTRSVVASVIALLLFGAIAVSYQRIDKALRNKAVPSLLVLVYGISSIWFISLFRTFVMPWYIPMASMFWIGLAGLACCSISETDSDLKTRLRAVPNTERITEILRADYKCYLAATLVVFSISVLFLSSNLRYDDKDCFARTSSPASEATLRNYDTAPTYCEDLLFQWGGGAFARDMKLLAEPLRKHMLSAFAPEQTWSLQGDFAIGKVSVNDYFSADGVEFIQGRNANRRKSWSSMEHLNLFVAPNHSVRWDMRIPEQAQSAQFASAVCSAERSTNDGGTVELQVLSSADSKVLLRQNIDVGNDWRPIELSLLPYRGKDISILLSPAQDKASCDSVWRYPRIDLVLIRDAQNVSQPVPLHPANTELYATVPAPTDRDLSFDGFPNESWNVAGLQLSDARKLPVTTFNTIAPMAAISTATPLNIDLSKYSELYVEMSASEHFDLRAMYFTMRFSDGTMRTFCISLLPDEKLHQYTYDLKLLEVPSKCTLTAITLSPRMTKRGSEAASFSIGGLRLIAK